MSGTPRAILLAAGRGRRLGSEEPKCLLRIAGRTLLERHLENLAEAGVTHVTVVVGFQAGKIHEALAASSKRVEVDTLTNDRFERGSIVSLHTAAKHLDAGCIWMDADVLYPAALMKRLVDSAHENCVLLDRTSEETGEEMMLGVRNGRVLRIARRVSPEGPWDLMGEAVGFAKVGPAGGAVMKRILATEVDAGRLDQEYEAAMNLAFAEIPWGFEPVNDFEWTEIDFAEDVVKAEQIALSSGG